MADIKAVDKSDSISMAVMAKSGVSVNISNSMASLNNESMAGVDDTTFKVRQDQADVMGAENPEGNMLDGLKQELNIPTVGNPQGNDENDESFIRQATIDIMEKYKTSQVLDEQDDDAYVSESSEDRDEELAVCNFEFACTVLGLYMCIISIFPFRLIKSWSS